MPRHRERTRSFLHDDPIMALRQREQPQVTDRKNCGGNFVGGKKISARDVDTDSWKRE